MSAFADKKLDDAAMFPLTEESKRHDGVKYGEWIQTKFADSKVFPGTERRVWVYVPAQYDGKTPACLMLMQDGPGFFIDNVVSNLLSKNEIPVMIVVASSPGFVKGDKDADSPRANRTYEYDTPSPRFGKYVLEELLPFAETLKTKDGREIKLSKNPGDRMVAGFSSGAAAAFNLAWAYPWEFSRVFTGAGSFTGLRGSYANSTLVHKFEPKPLRIFLQSGTRDMWTCFGDWWSANQAMVRALEFAGYEHKFAFGDASHSGKQAEMLMPEIMRYLWKDWPKPVAASTKTRNHVLNEVLEWGAGFEKIKGGEKGAALIMAENGRVVLSNKDCARLISGKGVSEFTKGLIARSTSGDLVLEGGQLKLLAGGKVCAIAKDISYASAFAMRDGSFYALLAGDGKSALVWISPEGNLKTIEENAASGGAIAASGNENWLYVFDSATRRGYNYKILPNGSLDCKQEFFFLHLPDQCDSTLASSAICDDGGRTYLATTAGIQICDYNGRSAAILELPKGERPVSLAFGGEDMNILYVVGELGNVYKRKIKPHGSSCFTKSPKIRVGAG